MDCFRTILEGYNASIPTSTAAAACKESGNNSSSVLQPAVIKFSRVASIVDNSGGAAKSQSCAAGAGLIPTSAGFTLDSTRRRKLAVII